MRVESDTLVDDVMCQAPATIRIFLDFRMKCVGCPIACFHTVDDACREHGVERVAFIAALRQCKDQIDEDRLSGRPLAAQS
jgi:hybrid cluster-associated redox disulfide protein